MVNSILASFGVGLLVLSHFARADDGGTVKLRLQAVTQYSKGDIRLGEDPKTSAPVVHATPLYEKEQVTLPAESLVKLVTTQECIAVVYGPGRVHVSDMGGVWKVEAQGVRWICPGGNLQSFDFKGSRFDVKGGEVFVWGDRVLALRGAVTVGGREALRKKQIYKIIGGKVERGSTSPEDVAELNHLAAAPVESLVLESPARRTRWTLGPGHAWGRILHENSVLDTGPAEMNTFRLQMQREFKGHSLVGLIQYSETNEKNAVSKNSIGSFGKLWQLTLEGGLRLWHVKWWSPFVRAGLGFQSSRLTVSRFDVGYGSDEIYQYMAFGLATGVDAFYFPRWAKEFGLYGALEATATRTFANFGVNTQSSNTSPPSNGSVPEALNKGGPLTTYGFGMALGLAYRY